MQCFVQNLELIYLIYRARYFYPVLVIGFVAAAATRVAVTIKQQHNKMLALVNECRLTPLVQDNWVRATASYRLVPGDVMVLQEGRAVCDMVMLRGACLVTESMLSGEVHPFTRINQDRVLCSCCVLSAWSPSLYLVLQTTGDIMPVFILHKRQHRQL